MPNQTPFVTAIIFLKRYSCFIWDVVCLRFEVCSVGNDT